MAGFRNDSIFWVEIDKIVPNPYQPRREFDEGKLKELSESIRMYGVLQPLTVSRIEVPTEDGAFRTEYELIAGERRLRASKLAGLSQVPVLIREGEESEQEKLELAIIENLQREDLNAVDRALAFRQLADVFGLSHAQVAKKVGRSREYVSNTIRLLALPDYMLQSLKEGDITEGHARTLLMLNDRPEEQDTVYREILLKKLSVREVERIARKIATDKVRNRTWENTDQALIEKEREFTETLGTRVQIAKTDYGGKITIDYFSEDDLEKFLAMMRQSKERFSLTAVAAVNDEIASVQAESDQTFGIEAHDAAADLSSVFAATPLEAVADSTHEADDEPPYVPPAPPETPPAPTPQPPAPQPEVPSYQPQPEIPQPSPAPQPSPTQPRSALRDRLSALFGAEAKAPAAPAPVLATPEAPVVAAVSAANPAPTQPERKAEDESTLYDLRNFSI
jgi:ParB family chromosome partitioning protein